MRLIFLGIASAFAVGDKCYQSNMLIESPNAKRMLIDCGSDIRHSLHDLGYSYSDLEAVYISHLHADHVGGLEWLGFAKFFLEQNPATLYISADQQQTLWNNVLSGGMSTLEDRATTLETFFKLGNIDNLSFVWENLAFQLVKTIHSYSDNQLQPSYGLFIRGSQSKIFISTDTRFTPELLSEFYQEADLIFQDCETSEFPSHQHAHYNELKTLPYEIKQKMWLYHYNNESLPDIITDGFKGLVTRGQVFDF